jgi:hypothetical protein
MFLRPHSDDSGWSPPQTRAWWSITSGHQWSETLLTGESRFHISTPQGIWTRVPCDGKQTGSPLDQWDMVWMKWNCRLSTLWYFRELVLVRPYEFWLASVENTTEEDDVIIQLSTSMLFISLIVQLELTEPFLLNCKLNRILHLLHQ